MNTQSNHSPQIIKRITQTISERLSRNSSRRSSSAEIFELSKVDYEKTLIKCDYKAKLQHTTKHQHAAK